MNEYTKNDFTGSLYKSNLNPKLKKAENQKVRDVLISLTSINFMKL